MSDQQPHINPTELNNTLSQSYIHYDPNRVDYTINEAELNQLENIGNSVWKEVFFATLGLWIPTLINAVVTQNKLPTKEPINTEIIINYIVAFSSLIICILSVFIWRSTNKKKENVINQIKNKPKFSLPK
jgi:hypothetical protein